MTPLHALAKSVAENGGIVHQAYAHMEAALASGLVAPGAPPPVDVLYSLLTELLADRLDDLDPIDLEMAARVLDVVGDTMAEQLFFLPLDGAPELN
jgi:hypothetical protein